MKSVFSKFVSVWVGALLLSSTVAVAATPAKFSGSIAGIVRDPAGIPQMGATVLLLNRYNRVLQKSLTDEKGTFGFETLLPDLYSVRVTLASFVPAIKDKIAVQPGMQSLLYINMAGLLSSVELVYAAPGQGALMSDDWKWTLRTAIAARPVLRLIPDLVGQQDPSIRPSAPSGIFSDTRGLLRLSGGDTGSLADVGSQPDLGTAFALATSFFGRNQLQLSANVGHTARSDLPAAALRASVGREGTGTEISVTIRQIYLPAQSQLALTDSGSDPLPPLRTMSLALSDHVELIEGLRLDYGMSLDTVSFLQHLNYFSPYARLSYDLGSLGIVRAGYSAGGPPAELFATRPDDEGALSDDLATLALMPRVSVRGERVRVQRTQNLELGYEKKASGRTYDLAVFREAVSDGALMVAGDFEGADILPDISSRSGILDIGGFTRYGYSASVTQPLGDNLTVGTSAGRAGVLLADERLLSIGDAGDLRSKIRTGQRYWAAARVSGTIPGSGTQISTSYEWTDYDAILPNHLYITQNSYPESGLNMHVRQPLPSLFGLPGRLEATADFRNVLAQGYLPFTAGPRRMQLVQSPRALRGGLSFIF